MQDNQTSFLDRIRAALGKEHGKPITREGLLAPTDDRDTVQRIASRSQEEQLALLRQFIENAGPLHLKVHPCTTFAAAADCITTLARESQPEFGVSKEIVIHDHPLLRTLQLEPLLAKETIPIHLTCSDDPAVRQHTLNAYIGITAPAWGIAESATIVQLTRPGQPRSTSLVPSIHIAVLPLAQLMATLAEAYALIRREQDLDSLVFISGPSKTADIEGHMVHGAHGPREMHVIIVTGES